MDLRVSTNPHLEPIDAKAFLEELLDRRKALWGPDVHGGSIDTAALDLLKSQLKNNSKAIKVK